MLSTKLEKYTIICSRFSVSCLHLDNDKINQSDMADACLNRLVLMFFLTSDMIADDINI